MTTPKKAPAKAAAKSAVAVQSKDKAPKPAVTAKSAPKVSPAKPSPAPAKSQVRATPQAKTKSPSPVARAETTSVKTKTVSSKTPSPQPGLAKESTPKSAASPQVKSMTAPTREAVQAPATPAPAPSAPTDQLVRATRPSARLAQITVPSLPPAVASTAAKSSFLPSTPSPAVNVPLVQIKKDPKLANNWKSKKVDELSDAEILAMPDAEYMNDTQMAYFRLKLSVLKQDILNSAGATTEHLREDTVVVPDPADRATIEEEHALELRTRDRERKLLKKIEQSIQRIDAGDYGFCDETGEAIGVGRLLARPTATLSLEAQQRRELKQKMFGD